MSDKNKKKKPKMARDWHAVNAHFRKAGNMGDERKEKSLKECRTWKLDYNKE